MPQNMVLDKYINQTIKLEFELYNLKTSQQANFANIFLDIAKDNIASMSNMQPQTVKDSFSLLTKC